MFGNSEKCLCMSVCGRSSTEWLQNPRIGFESDFKSLIKQKRTISK